MKLKEPLSKLFIKTLYVSSNINRLKVKVKVKVKVKFTPYV